jgi:hypothetical protein
VQWGRGAIAVFGVAAEYRDRIMKLLRGEPVEPIVAPPPAPDFHPRRDERFQGQYNFEFAPHVVYNMPEASAAERNLALLCKRTLEMDVPEMMASFITQRADQPWEFHRDYSRQLWDEMRHAMMGTVALEARGVEWKRDIPLNVSFALRLNLHAEPLERQMMLYAIEQSLMPAETGKRFEYETAVAAGDALSAHFTSEAFAFRLTGQLDSAEARLVLATRDTMFVEAGGLLAMIRFERTGDRMALQHAADSIGAIHRKWLYGVQHTVQAGLVAELGDRDRAMGLLRRAIDEGQQMQALHRATMLEALWTDKAFRALLTPVQ